MTLALRFPWTLLGRSGLSALLILATCLSALGRGAAQEVPAQETSAEAQVLVDQRLVSPRATMSTFLDAMNAVKEGHVSRWGDAVLCLELSDTDARGAMAERQLALELWGALNRIRYIELEELPSADALREDQDAYLFFPRPNDPQDREVIRRIAYAGEHIELVRSSRGNWRFSGPTMAGIGNLFAKLEPLDSVVDVDESSIQTEPWLRRQMPAVLITGEIISVEYWQWLGLLLLALAGVTLDLVLRAVLRPVVAHAARRFQSEASDEAVRNFVRPLGLLASGLLWLALVRALGFSGSALEVLLAAIRAFTILSGTWAAWRLADLGADVLAHQAARTASTIDDVLVPLVRKTAKLFIVAFGLVYAAQSLHFNIVPLITGLGIGGLAFAFAAKDTIENLFGSIAVILDRPFEVGDWVVIGETEGTVEDLGFRSTRIRTFYNSQVTVPNSQLVRAVVDNYGRRRYRRWRTVVGVQYDTPPDKLLAFTEGIRELVRTHPYMRKDYYQVWANDFADSSLNVLVYVFFDVPDWSTELRERERLFVDIVRLADRLEVQFAFPTQTVHLHRGAPTPTEPVYSVPDARSDRTAHARGIRAARELTRGQPWRKTPPEPVSFGSEDTHLDIDDPLEATEDTSSRKRTPDSGPE
jgi:MscS family membrane protein